MTDFQDALRARLQRNEEIAREREAAERKMDRVKVRQTEEAERRRREAEQARAERHAELVEHLQGLMRELVAAAPQQLDARAGWTQSGEEFVAKFATVQLQPRRSLLIELDRDDDEVLARWSSQMGDTVEMWRLSEFTREMLGELVLQVIDDELWRGRTRPPEFPVG